MASSSRLIRLLGLLGALTLAVGCVSEDPAAEDNDEMGESSEAIVAPDTSSRTNALERGELVLTIDEMPNYGKEEAIARALRESNVTATIFIVGERLGSVRPRDGSVYGAIESVQNIDSLLQNGHLLANHTYSHPIGGAAKAPYNPRGCSYASMLAGEGCPNGKQQAIREVVWTQQLIIEAVKRAGGADPGRYAGQVRRWFRPSGGSWNGAGSQSVFSSELDRLVSTGDTTFSGFEAPIGWNVPVAPRQCGGAPIIRNGVIARDQAACRAREGSLVDWECHALYRLDASFMPPAKCADNYMAAVARAGDKGVALFHGNLDTDNYSQALMLSFIAKARAKEVGGKKMRIVHPDCAIPSTRTAAVSRGLCQ